MGSARGQLSLEEASGMKRISTDEPLPPHVCAVLGAELVVNVAGLPSVLIDQMKRLAAFENPEFYKKQAMRMSTALTPRVISCAEVAGDRIGLPRGCVPALEELIDQHGIELEIDDQRSDGEAIGVEFHGELTCIQQQAARSLLAPRYWCLCRSPWQWEDGLGCAPGSRTGTQHPDPCAPHATS